MDDNNVAQTEKRTRKRVRRNFAKDLADLEARVSLAVRLLKRVQEPTDIIAAAIEMLEEG